MDALIAAGNVLALWLYAIGGPAAAVGAAIAWKLHRPAWAFLLGSLTMLLMMQMYGLAMYVAGQANMTAWLVNRLFLLATVGSLCAVVMSMWREYARGLRVSKRAPRVVLKAIGAEHE